MTITGAITAMMTMMIMITSDQSFFLYRSMSFNKEYSG
jgi:hypothetical protein